MPLSQFARAGKRGHYLSAGVVMLESVVDDSAQLNFTHRTAHGGDGDTAAAHGTLTALAEAELSHLKR